MPKKALTKKEMRTAMKYGEKTVLRSYDHDENEEFLSVLSAEEQRSCFEHKPITLNPLTEKDIRDLSFELMENGYEGTIVGKDVNEKLQIIRENKELINEFIESTGKYEERLFLDEVSNTKELKWSASKAWEIVKSHLDIEIP